jgi:hypothetical protein
MSQTQPKLIIGRTGANTFKFSPRTEHASLTGELSISLGENVPDHYAFMLMNRSGAEGSNQQPQANRTKYASA